MIAAAAATAAAFNLLCTGTVYTAQAGGGLADSLQTIIDTSNGIVPKQAETSPWKSEFRLNVAQRRWCADYQCAETWEMAHVDAKTIEIYFSPTRKMEINRETGGFVIAGAGNGPPQMIKGTCSRRPFKGFPPRRF